MQDTLIQQIDKLQEQGRLLDRFLLEREASFNHRRLLSPCRTLRSLLLGVDLGASLSSARHSAASTPFPLADIFSSDQAGASSSSSPADAKYGSWNEYAWRHTACIINEAAIAIDESCKAAMQMYLEEIDTPSQDPLQALRLPLIKSVTLSEMSEPEPLPPNLAKLTEPIVSEEWLQCTVTFRNYEAKNGWNRTMIPHTGLLFFIHDAKYNEHTVLSCYTLPKQGNASNSRPSAGTSTSTAQTPIIDVLDDAAAEDSSKSQIVAIRLRMSICGLVIDSNRKAEQIPSSLYETSKFVRDSLADPKRYTVRVARTESLFMTEYTMSNLPRLASGKRDALLRPTLHAASFSFGSQWSAQTAMEIFIDYHEAVSRIALVPPSPQQLRFCLAFFFHVWTCANATPAGELTFNFTSLGGPPGTGKTSTIALALLLLRVPSHIREVVEILNFRLGYTFAEPQSAVDKILDQKIVYSAPTNDAVDNGCKAIHDLVSVLRNRNIIVSATPVRVCEFAKATKKPETTNLHYWVECARRCYAAHESIWQANDGPRRARAAARAAKRSAHDWARRHAKQDARDRGEPDSGPVFEADWEEILERLEREHPNAAKETPEQQAENNKLDAQKNFLQAFIDKPSDFGARSGRQALKRWQKELLQSQTEAVLRDPCTIACFTPGYTNPYHPEVVATCEGSVAVLDEAGQCTQVGLAALMLDSHGIVLCGDAKQLGAVLKGPIAANIDARHSTIHRLEAVTIWLTICWRCPIAVTDFLNRHVYRASGLFHPRGQNRLRASPLSVRRLFKPVVVIDVVDGTSDLGANSTSRKSSDEIDAIADYLALYTVMAAQLDLGKISLAIITPYTAQGGELETLKALLLLQYSDRFSSIQTGTIETIQGATVDMCIITCAMSGMDEKSTVSTRFLTQQRLTVALSRSRYQLVLVCNRAKMLARLADEANPLLEAFLAEFASIPVAKPSYAKGMLEAASPSGSTRSVDELSTWRECNAPIPEELNPWLSKAQTLRFDETGSTSPSKDAGLLDATEKLESALSRYLTI